MVATSTVLLILAVVVMQAPGNSCIQLRLIPSNNSYNSGGGRLEIYYSSAWRPFCSYNFNIHTADLACKKLGYLQVSNYGRVGRLGYSQSNGMNLPVSTYCYGSTFDSCYNYITSCTHYYDVAINCVTKTQVSVNRLRLVSSSSSSSGGRLEIYYYFNHTYTWRPFCTSYFHKHEAKLACKKLGYSYVSTYGRVGSLGYSQGNGSYSIIANCYHTSTRFDSCSNSITSSCTHYSDVAIKCSNIDTTAGLISGLVIAFIFVFCCFGGIIVCTVVITYVFFKKRSTKVRIVNVVPTHPAPNTVTLTTQANDTVPNAAPPYTPSPYTSSMQQQEIYKPQKGENYENVCPAYQEETKGHF